MNDRARCGDYEVPLDYERLLELARDKVAKEMRLQSCPAGWQDQCRRRVVREFLERICPIRVDEAYDR